MNKIITVFILAMVGCASLHASSAEEAAFKAAKARAYAYCEQNFLMHSQPPRHHCFWVSEHEIRTIMRNLSLREDIFSI